MEEIASVYARSLFEVAKEQDKLKLSLTEMMRLDPRQAAKGEGQLTR